MKGMVKWFSEEKGYGFITSENGEDHYFNVQGVKGVELPSTGDSVSFESRLGDKGLRASNVMVLEKRALEAIGRVDDRVDCPGCGKRIVPRIIIYNGEPYRSVCPFCATTVRKFTGPNWPVIVLGGSAIIALIYAMLRA